MGFNAKDEVQYNLPSSGEIAAIVVGDCSKKNIYLRCISEIY